MLLFWMAAWTQARSKPGRRSRRCLTKQRSPARRSRAGVVVHRGKIIAERYGPGFTRDTRLEGWSMAKSVTNALIGNIGY